jgi:Retrotransposon gag protein
MEVAKTGDRRHEEVSEDRQGDRTKRRLKRNKAFLSNSGKKKYGHVQRNLEEELLTPRDESSPKGSDTEDTGAEEDGDSTDPDSKGSDELGDAKEKGRRTPSLKFPSDVNDPGAQEEFSETLSKLITRTVDRALKKQKANPSQGNASGNKSKKKQSIKVREKEESLEENEGDSSTERMEESKEGNPDFAKILRNLNQEIQELKRKAVESSVPEVRRSTPFIDEIMKGDAPPQSQIPNLEYDGTTDPTDHLGRFENVAVIYQWSDAITCRIFPITLTKLAQRWYLQLPPKCIHNFEGFKDMFLKQFTSSKKCQKLPFELFNTKQRGDETLRQYLTRYNKVRLEVPSANEDIWMNALVNGIRKGPFFDSLIVKAPRNFGELLQEAESYIHLEEASKIKEDADKGKDKRNRDGKSSETRDRDDKGMSSGHIKKYTPLTHPREEILQAMEKMRDLRWPRTYSTSPKREESDYFCRFHNDYGHTTESCTHLKYEIERQIRKGRLQEFVGSERKGENGGNGQDYQGDDDYEISE